MQLLPSVLLVAFAAGFAPRPAPPPADTDPLKTSLERLDAASKKFVSAQATVHKVFHSALIPGDDVQEGEVFFKREAGATEMGSKTTSGPDASIISFKNGVLKVYGQKTKHCDVVSKPGLDTYVTLGFGGSGSDLAKVWTITDKGTDKIDGTTVEVLELVPIKQEVRNNVKKFTLWVDLTRAVSLKQVLLEPTNDTVTFNYTITKYNQPIDTKPFAIPGGCK